jgi:hypothetical protein
MSMDIYKILEMLSMFSTMLGAFYISKKDMNNNKLKGFVFFMIGNITMFFVSIEKGMFPLFVQLCFFSIGAFLGLKHEFDKKKKDIFNLLIILAFFFFVILLFFLNNINSFNFNLLNQSYLELTAAIIAISGNFLVKYSGLKKFYAFFMFFIADIFYIKVAINHEMWFFMTQSMFFIYTSFSGMYYSYNEYLIESKKTKRKIFKYG